MQLDISLKDAAALSAGLGLLAEVMANPDILRTLSVSGRAAMVGLREAGQWPDHERVERLLSGLHAGVEKTLA